MIEKESQGGVAFLGDILWFTVTARGDLNASPTRDQLERLFEQGGIPETWLPPRINAVGAFRTAASRLSLTYPNSGWAVTVTAKKEIKATPEVVKREILRTQEHPRKSGAIVDKIGELAFYRPRRQAAGRQHGTETWKAELHPDLGDVDRAKTREAIDLFRKEYELMASHYDPDDVRRALRDYLISGLNAVTVRPGTYFAHARHSEDLTRLGQMILSMGADCTFHRLPLVDTPEQRRMLLLALDEEMVDDVRLLIKDAGAAAARFTPPRRVPFTKVDEIRLRYAQLVERCEEHGSLLELVPDRTAEALEDARSIVMELLARAAAPSRTK